MRVVVDLGCMKRNGADSVKVLARKYRPDMMYAFDPSPLLEPGERLVWKRKVVFERLAAATFDGTVGFFEDGTGSRTGHGGHPVRCFDFSYWLGNRFAPTLWAGGGALELIVKMDIEGAEVPILERMIADGTDRLVSELLVEWHGAGEELEERLACRVRRWWL